jgi:hypothetical protein
MVTGPWGVNVSENVWLAAVELASVTLTVNVNVPALTATPANTPPGESEKAPGKLPCVSDQVYGATPPAALSVCEYDVPTTPEGRVGAVKMASGPRAIGSENAKLAVAESEPVTVAVNAKVPAAVGVPAINPPEESARPAGSAPDVSPQAYGGVPQQARSPDEYGVPTMPSGSREGVVMASGVGKIVRTICSWAVIPHTDSVTTTAKLNVPAAVGVPDIAPPVESVRPLGSDPDARLHVYGSPPPTAVSPSK